MGRQGFRWIDSDMHLAEPGDLWVQFIDPRYRDQYRSWTPADPRYTSLREPAFSASTAAAPVAPIQAGPVSLIKARRFKDFTPFLADDGVSIGPDGQLRAMDVEGIDIAVLFPTVGLPAVVEAPPDVAAALARGYNDWLAAFCRYDPARLKLCALIPFGDVEEAVAEIRRSATALGAVGLFPVIAHQDPLRISPARLDDPVYEPIWAEAERQQVAIAFHGSIQTHLRDRYRGSDVFVHATGRSVEHPLSFLELTLGGVFERHPTLHFAFLEAGCSWVLYWLFRAEEEWERYRDTVPGLAEQVKLRPVEYWQRQCWSAVEVDEWTLPAVISTLGDDGLVISSDFPHFDSAFPHAFDRFMQIPGLSDDSKRKVLWDNCARLYRLS